MDGAEAQPYLNSAPPLEPSYQPNPNPPFYPCKPLWLLGWFTQGEAIGESELGCIDD